MRKTVTALTIAVAAMLCLAPTGTPATSANSVCPKLTGPTSCGNAKHWVLTLLAERVHGTGRVPLHGGPGGYHCVGNLLDAKGHPYWGMCYQHTIAFPKNGISWSPA